LHKKGRRPLV